MHSPRPFNAHWLFRGKRIPRLWRRVQSTGGDKQAAGHHFESRTPRQARSPGTTCGRLSPVSLMSNRFDAHRRVAIGAAVRTRRRACQPARASSLSISLPMRHRRRGLKALDNTLSGPPIAGLKFLVATAAIHHLSLEFLRIARFRVLTAVSKLRRSYIIHCVYFSCGRTRIWIVPAATRVRLLSASFGRRKTNGICRQNIRPQCKRPA